MDFMSKGIFRIKWFVVMFLIGCILIQLLSHRSQECPLERVRENNITCEPTVIRKSSLFFDYIEEMRQLNEAKVKQDDPRLIRLIRDYYILPPSSGVYTLQNPGKSDYAGQGKDNMIPQLLTDVPERGLFVDCGAYDGEEMSHTLYFEKTKHWRGLLIEANPDLFRKLRAKNRKSYTLNACLNTKPHPAVMTFNMFYGIGRLVEDTFQDAYKHHHGLPNKKILVTVQCFPLYSVLLALGQTHVDFFSLDVEGLEVDILKTLPWDKVNITYIMAEFSHGEGGKQALQGYLGNNGYKTIKEFKEDVLVKKVYT